MPAEYGEPLSERELEIVALVADGMTNREIAYRIERSPNTVKVHLRNIFTKTGVVSRTELTVLAMQEGWIDVPGVTTEASPEAASDETALEQVPALSFLPDWPRSRWLALGIGLFLAFVVLVVPQRPAGQAAAPAGSGLVDQPEAPVVAAEPTEEDGWMELSPLPARRARMGTAVLQGRIYAVGGIVEGGLTDRLDIYDIESDEWKAGVSYPLAVANVGVAPVNGKLLVAGGCDASGQPSTLVHLYDPVKDTWAEVAPLPQPLCAYAMSAWGESIYIFGGWDGFEYQAVAYAYDGEADTWAELSDPSEARGFGASTVLSDRLFYVGGYDDKRELTTCEVYLPKDDRWESCAPLLLPRGGLGLAAVGGRLFALGGGWTNYLGFSERYDPASNTWTVIETPIVGEWRNLGLVVWDTSLFAVGGWSGDYMNRVYTFEALPWRIFIPTTFFSP